MCGRFTLRTKLNLLLQQFAAEASSDLELVPRYNIAPTQDIPVVRVADGKRELTLMRWGLIPSWTKDPKSGPLLINARSDTVAAKPAFRSAFKCRRCLIPADGYYEWMAEGKKKQPYWFRVRDGQTFAFAGLWERWHEIESCVILTTEANEMAAKLHDRMPVSLSPNDYERWLECDVK
jgi:putative SOS response-associated peptidase YedK